MSSPSKVVAKTFRAMGARVVGPHQRGTTYQFPDGATKHVPTNMKPVTARGMLGWARDRYGHLEPDTPFSAEKVKGGSPRVDLNRVVASNHAKERLALMRSQARIEFSDILMALRAPIRTLYSEKHSSWLWVGERITVAAHVNQDGFAVISTLLWSTRELWNQNPRPN